MQRAAIERRAQELGDTVGAWYSETASVSRRGTAADVSTRGRPEFRRLLDDVAGGHVARLYVYRLDRLTRTGIRDTLGLVQDLRRAGVELVSVADGLPELVGNGATTEILLAVMAWAAEMETLALRERVSTARAHARAQGTPWGRPRRLNDDQVRLIRTLHRDHGLSARQLAVRFDVSRSIVGRALARKSPYHQVPEIPIPGRRGSGTKGRLSTRPKTDTIGT